MKSITNKKIIFSLVVLLTSVFMFGLTMDEVEATSSISAKDVTVECTYSDGSVFSYSYNTVADEYVINRTTTNVSNASNMTSGTTGTTIFASGTKPIKTEDNFQCEDYVIEGLTKNDDDSTDDYEAVVTVYKFSSSSSESFASSDIDSCNDEGWFWTCNDASNLNNTKKTYQLLSENVQVTNQSISGDETYYKKYTTQVAAESTYATVTKYSNITLIQVGAYTTTESGSSSYGDVIYLNDPKPTSTVGTSGTMLYTFPYVRFKAADSSSTTTPYKFEKVDQIDDDGSSEDGDLCTSIMPETALVLKDIIKYMQLGVPLFLVILTALDLGKIVMAGKIDDELPKQRKRIIIRFIVACSFFFLPLVVNLLISMLQTSGSAEGTLIKQIGCLFD